MSIEGQSHFLTLVFTGFVCFFASTRPRYQVSVYMTIGPLVLNMKPSKGKKKVTWPFLDLRLRSFTSEILGIAVAWLSRSRTPDPEVWLYSGSGGSVPSLLKNY